MKQGTLSASFAKHITILLIFTNILYESIAQVDTLWTYRTSGSQINGGSIIGDALGNCFISGHVMDNYLIFKLNPSGILEWSKIYDGPGNGMDIPQAMALDADNNIVTTGYSYGGNITDTDYLTIKHNSSGDSIWAMRHNGFTPNPPTLPNDVATAVTADDSGNVYVTGYSSGPVSITDAYTIKYSSTGDSLWAHYYNFPATNGGDRGWAITLDLTGNVIVAGESWGGTQIPPATGNDYLILKYSPSGTLLWAKRHETQAGPSDDVAWSVITDSDGDIYVTGSAQAGANYIATIKISDDGDSVIWQSNYGIATPNLYTLGIRVALDDSGNVYVAGRTSHPNYLLLKYNPSGVLLWAKEYDSPGSGSDQLFDMKIDDDGNIYLTGASSGDFVTVKYNSLGEELWVHNYNYNNSNDKIAVAMHVFEPGELAVTGYAFASGEICVVRLSENPTDVDNDNSSSLPTEYMLYQNYPNPFNPSTKISWQSPVSSWQTLKVYDMLGNEVATLVNEYKDAGSYEVEFNVRASHRLALTSGVYYYQLRAGDFIQTKKMLIIK